MDYTPAEDDIRDLLMYNGRTAHWAAYILNNIDNEKPWYYWLDYLRALLAIAAAYPWGDTPGILMCRGGGLAISFVALLPRMELAGNGTRSSSSGDPCPTHGWHRSQPAHPPTSRCMRSLTAVCGTALSTSSRHQQYLLRVVHLGVNA